MSRSSRAAILAAVSIVWGGVSASAETLRCQSINGNLNCAGSHSVSCQTIDGRKVCVSGGGDVVQSFGGHAPMDDLDDPAGIDEQDPGKPKPPAKGRHGRGGHTRTDSIWTDRD